MMNVCPYCFNDEGLKKRIVEIRRSAPNEKCSFHDKYKGVPISAVAKIVDAAFRNQYAQGNYDSFDGEQHGETLDCLVEDITSANDYDIAKALADQLIQDENYWPQDGEEAFYGDDQNYEEYENTYSRHSTLWTNFCKSITYSQRFFNNDARLLLTEIFNGVQLQRDHQRRSVVYEIKPGSLEATFFRARIAESDDKRQEILNAPETQLGPPPERYRRAGRMNSAGIGCFYAAFDLPTCIAELRPGVGCTVVGAQFQLTRPIHALDTTGFSAPIRPLNIFSKHYMSRTEQWSFMQHFCHEIAKPILRNDEHLDYIPTQAVAEYFLHHHQCKKNGKPIHIEAIIFESAQFPGGRNIVLLGDAAHVTRSQKENRHTSDKSAPSELFPVFSDALPQNPPYPRNAAIRIIENSVEVRRITGARYDSEHAFSFDDYSEAE